VAACAALVAVWGMARLITALAPAGGHTGARRSAGPTTTIPPPSSPADIDAFLAAERRMLLGTWAVTETFTRKSADGRQLTSTIRRAQRPPDSLNEGPSSAEVLHQGRQLSCAAGPTGGLVCRDTGPAVPYPQQVDAQVATLRGYVVASLPLYRVARAAGAGPGNCWRLVLAAPLYPSPPYGQQAVFCFDPVTAAPIYSQQVRPQATDTTQAADVRGTVTDTDLTVASPPGR
jgi:hypothetical protein